MKSSANVREELSAGRWRGKKRVSGVGEEASRDQRMGHQAALGSSMAEKKAPSRKIIGWAQRKEDEEEAIVQDEENPHCRCIRNNYVHCRL